MALFEIFKQPVELIKVMSKITTIGRRYKKDPSSKLLHNIETGISDMQGYFERAGVPRVITKVHAGIMFEMALDGTDLPSLAAVEQAIIETLEEGGLTLEVIQREMTPEEEATVDKMLKQLGNEKKGDNDGTD